MVNWQVTATTIYCDAVDEEVTLLVYKDWSIKCTGYGKYGEPSKEMLSLLKKKSKQSKRRLKCTGPECQRVTQYKEKLFAEEAKQGYSE
ncbi:MAG TPA: hypothetical protein G4N93_04165 [Dehalococcoidia bacterium]|nr:hypothetical protein [Dehalococcoidia bacterium]